MDRETSTNRSSTVVNFSTSTSRSRYLFHTEGGRSGEEVSVTSVQTGQTLVELGGRTF